MPLLTHPAEPPKGRGGAVTTRPDMPVGTVRPWCHPDRPGPGWPCLGSPDGGGAAGAALPTSPCPSTGADRAMTAVQQQTGSAVRPFHAEIAEDALDDLRRRLAATRWPSRELVGDRSQGVQLATMQALCRYWE